MSSEEVETVSSAHNSILNETPGSGEVVSSGETATEAGGEKQVSEEMAGRGL